MPRARSYAFALLWLLVIGISVQDGYFVLLNRLWMTAFERNPVGRLLLDWDGGDVWVLLATKAIGTVCAASVLLVLYWTLPRFAWAACITTAALQLILLLFLYLA